MSESSRPARSSPASGRREKPKSAESNISHRRSNNSSTDSNSQASAADSQKPRSDASDGSSNPQPISSPPDSQPTAANSPATLPDILKGLTPDPLPAAGVPTGGTPIAQSELKNLEPIAVPQPATTVGPIQPAAATDTKAEPSRQTQLAQAIVTPSVADPSAKPNPNAATTSSDSETQIQAAADTLAPVAADAIPVGTLKLPIASRTQSTDTAQIVSTDPNSTITVDRELIDQAIVTAVASATNTTADAPSADQRQRRADDSPISQPAAANQPADLARSTTASSSQAAANTTARISTSSLIDKTTQVAPRGAQSQVDQARFVQRVARAFRAADEQGGQIRLRLSPPELGSLKLDIALRNGQMTARLEAETTTARSLLLDNLPALRERLAGQNIKIERFDVDLKQDAAGNGSPNMPQDFAGSRQPSPRFENSRPVSSITRTDDGLQPVNPSAASTDGRINIVI
jgi:flagellar hook-length control protein FliK